MKSIFTTFPILLFLLLSASSRAQIGTSSQWTWVNGASTTSQAGVYGTMGVAAPGNRPGARQESLSWTDAAGNFWLFGGNGYAANGTGTNSFLNDLWKFNPTSNQWTWVNGSNSVNNTGIYGTMGVAAAGNRPGARQESVGWTDAAGNFWLFGGDGYAVGSGGDLNDFWKYNPGANQWTWVNGSNFASQVGVYGTMGVAAAGNKPGARRGSVGWTDAAGNFWLFGGYGYSSTVGDALLNDLWKLSSTIPSQIIAFDSIPNKTYGDPSFTINAVASSGLPVTYSIVSGPATIAGNTITITGAGTVVVEALQAGNTTYGPSSAQRTFIVQKALATVALSNLNQVFDGTSKIPATVINPVGLQVDFLFNGVSTAPVNAGNYYVVATINNPNYTGTANDTFSILKADQFIALVPTTDKTYGVPPFIVQATSTSGLPVLLSINANPPNTATLTGNTITIQNIGTVIISASQPGNVNYNAAIPVTDTFNVVKANQQISVSSMPDVTIDTSVVIINATVNSGLPLTYSITTNPAAGVASLSGNSIHILGDTGKVTVKVNQPGNQFYNPAEVERTFRVLGRPQLITFSPIPSHTFGDPSFNLTASASSGLPVQYTIISGAAFLSGNVLTVAGAGNITIEANQLGNDSIRVATPVRQTFNVSKAAQTISIDSIADKTYGDAPFTVTAMATSGLPVTFSILSGYAYVSGNQVVLTGAGPVVISASQNGNQNYLSAVAQRTFCMASKKPQKIYGFTQSCISTQQYSIDTIAGTTYTWTVSGGGTLVSTSGSKVNVSWNTIGAHELTVRANNSCNSGSNDTTCLKVQVIDLPVPPDVSNLFPGNSAVIKTFPLSLSWQASGTSQVYDLYIWPESSTQPATPYIANLQTVAYVISSGSQLPAFAPGVRYNWKVITKNACKQSTGASGYFSISKLPNLVLQSVQAPDTTFSGKAIDVTIKMLNNGGTSTGNTHWTDAVYLSRDNILNTQVDTYVGGTGNLSALDSGQQYINTLHINLPKNTIGDYHLFTVANAYNSLTEATRSDDTIVRPIVIRLTPPPDLQVTVVATPGDAFSAQYIPVTYTVKNKGAGPTNASKWIDSIYISSEPVFNRSTAVKVGGTEHLSLSSLLPDSSYTKTVTVSLPARFLGINYIFVETDVKDSVYEFTFENNNTNRNDSVQIFLTPPPDFVVSADDIPGSISSQERLIVGYLVKNVGATAPTPIERKWLDGIYISKDSVFNIKRCTLLDYTIPYTRTIPQNCGLSSGGGGGGGSAGFSIPGSYSTSGGHLPEYCDLALGNIKSYTDIVVSAGNDTTYYIHIPCVRNMYHPFMLHDEEYNNKIRAVIPDSLEGTYYLYVYTDFSNAVFEFQNENNNTRVHKVQILNPDLMVDAVVVADTVGSGITAPLSWRVKNSGSGKVVNKTRKDLVWLSNSPVYNPATMMRLDSITYCTAIDSGSSVIKQKTVRIPDGLSGNYYLFVETDKDNAIYEGNHETNNYLSKQIKINLTPSPDLRINSIQLSKDSVDLDEGFILSYNVSNNGVAPIAGKTWKDFIYVTKTAVFDTANAYKAAEVFRTQFLDTNTSYTVNQSMRIDGGVLTYVGPSSNYYVHVFTDGGKEIYEHGAENNNLKSSGKLFLRNSDLAITTVNGSINVFSGANASVSWQVLNNGGKTGAGVFANNWDDKVYLSVDTVLDAADAEILAEYINGPILANGTYNRTLNYRVPNGYSGSYYLFVKTDVNDFNHEINKANNVNTIRAADGTPKPISVTLTPSPDLVVSALDAPSVGYTGQPITIKWQVKNAGGGSTLSGGWKEKIYLTANPNAQLLNPAEATLIGTYARTGNLGKDSSYADSVTVFVPAILSGNYYLVFATDFPSQVYEHNAENNNSASKQIFIIRPQPSDLVVRDIAVPSQALAGDTLTVSWKVRNIGVNPSEGYFTQGIYLSKDSAWSVDDALVNNSEATIYISPSDEKPFSKIIRATGTKEGRYFVIIKTDLTNNIVESNDDDNTGISTDSLSVTVLNLPLNIVTAHPLVSKSELYYKLNIPDSLEGETILVSLGSNLPVTPNELYISFGDMPSRSSFNYGYQNANSGKQDIVIPAAKKGNYYILAYNSSNTAQNNITLLAQRISFSVMNVHTNEGGNTGLVTVKIQGAKFEPGMQLTLQSNTLGSILANSVQFVNSTTAFATFNLSGKSIGLYNVVAKKGGSDTTSLANGFRILQGSGGGFQGGGSTSGGFYCTIRNIGVDQLVNFDVQNPESVRVGRYFQTEINFGNSGNVDVPLPGRLLVSLSGSPIALSQEGLSQNKTELFLEFNELNGPEGVLRPGATGSITIYAKGSVIGKQTYRLIE